MHEHFHLQFVDVLEPDPVTSYLHVALPMLRRVHLLQRPQDLRTRD